jgi:hypothetical protein
MSSGAFQDKQGHARQRKVERAMGIEPTRQSLLGLENKRFSAMADPKCDGRVNFSSMWATWGYSMCQVPGSSSVVGL